MRVFEAKRGKSTRLESGKRSKRLVDESVWAQNLQIIWIEAPAGWKSNVQTRKVEEIINFLSGKYAVNTDHWKVGGHSWPHNLHLTLRKKSNTNVS